MMNRLIILCALGAVAHGFVMVQQRSAAMTITSICTPLPPARMLHYSSKHDTDIDDIAQQQVIPVGTFVEFEEKKRTHIGKIESVEHKSSGGGAPRYHIIDSEGKKWDMADKAILYSMPCPNSPGQAETLFQEFCRAQDAPADTLQAELDISPELLEMAWEEVFNNVEDENHMLTASFFIELVQGHAASAMEKYLAWKLLRTEMAHVFFKEIKHHGRVVAFKAKTRKAVDAAKEAFCKSHADNEICFA